MFEKKIFIVLQLLMVILITVLFILVRRVFTNTSTYTDLFSVLLCLVYTRAALPNYDV
jgi:hypothetical protein